MSAYGEGPAAAVQQANEAETVARRAASLHPPPSATILDITLPTALPMLSAIIALAVFGAVALAWISARGAAEVAAHYGRRACSEGGVQWLDHTVVLERLGLKRAPDGWIRPLRRYRFEFSASGHDRQRGYLELLGTELQWLRMPPQPQPEPIPAPEAHAGSGWQASLRLGGNKETNGDA